MRSIIAGMVVSLNISSLGLAASTSTQLKCATKLGNKSVQPVPTVGKTTTKPTKIYTDKSTVTPIQSVTPKPKITTVKTTTTSSVTVRTPANSATITTTETNTITIGTVTTETYTDCVFTTETATNTDTTTTIPTPAVFTPVLQENGYVPKIKGRELIPRASAAGPDVVRYSIVEKAKTQSMAPTQYPNAVTCTSTCQPYTTVTKTVTGKTRATTLPKVTSTSTKTFSTTTSTQVPPGVIVTLTVTSTSTYHQSGMTSTTTVDTTVTATESVLVPRPTYYAACSDDNLATNANGGYTISGVGISGSNYYIDATGSAYDCCAACQASNCKASFYFAAAYPDQVCFNSYLDTCTPGSVTDYFYTYSDQSYGYVVSNGPCGQIQDGGNYPSYN